MRVGAHADRSETGRARRKEGWLQVSVAIVHPGGEYLKGDRDYREIKAQIERWLGER